MKSCSSYKKLQAVKPGCEKPCTTGVRTTGVRAMGPCGRLPELIIAGCKKPSTTGVRTTGVQTDAARKARLQELNVERRGL